MRILLDTNVVLDLFLAREPFVSAASSIFSMVERSEVDGLLCATTLTTVDYLLGRSLPRSEVRTTMRRLLDLFDVAAVNRAVLEAAWASAMTDFEDAVLAEAAHYASAERIVTRNPADFGQSPVLVLDPSEFLTQFGGDGATNAEDGDDRTGEEAGDDTTDHDAGSR